MNKQLEKILKELDSDTIAQGVLVTMLKLQSEEILANQDKIREENKHSIISPDYIIHVAKVVRRATFEKETK